MPTYLGTPPLCRPECTGNQECPSNMACMKQKCIDPCPGACGRNTQCSVVNHNPFCSCLPGFTGNPFVTCERKIEFPSASDVEKDLCIPSPCGSNSECRVIGETPSCTCLDNFIGSPPYCRPQCVSNSECAPQFACNNQQCEDPCVDLCGTAAVCRVVSHTPMCTCPEGFTGDPFTSCIPRPVKIQEEHLSPCNPSPCGPNSECLERNGAGACHCFAGYFGNPYEACRPECILNSDCPMTKACQQQKCRDPCPGACGVGADCIVINHLPTCNCLLGYTGDPYRSCSKPKERKRFHYLYTDNRS